MHELQQAKEKQDQADMLKHIENIRLLCDLFLPEEKKETASVDSKELSAEELKTMLGKEKTPSLKPQPKFRKSIELDDEDGNGDSLFDF